MSVSLSLRWMANRNVFLPMDHFQNICLSLINGVIYASHQIHGFVNGSALKTLQDDCQNVANRIHVCWSFNNMGIPVFNLMNLRCFENLYCSNQKGLGHFHGEWGPVL